MAEEQGKYETDEVGDALEMLGKGYGPSARAIDMQRVENLHIAASFEQESLKGLMLIFEQRKIVAQSILMDGETENSRGAYKYYTDVLVRALGLRGEWNEVTK